jgi:hypothetical protein
MSFLVQVLISQVAQSAPVPVGVLPVIAAVAPSTDITSTPPNDTPLFVYSGDEADNDDDDMVLDEAEPRIEAVIDELRSINSVVTSLVTPMFCSIVTDFE